MSHDAGRTQTEAIREVERRISECGPCERAGAPEPALTDGRIKHLRRIAIAVLPNAGDDIAAALDELLWFRRR